ncbi:MAG: DUF4976 domain-containing protein, partial [Planctomycetaceae bacterium]|nr:DUF4976 domain-containing protein [Planctomycetaceae bacterium]
PATNEWNMFDLTNDPQEMVNVYNQPKYKRVQASLEQEFDRLRVQYDAPPFPIKK